MIVYVCSVRCSSFCMRVRAQTFLHIYTFVLSTVRRVSHLYFCMFSFFFCCFCTVSTISKSSEREEKMESSSLNELGELIKCGTNDTNRIHWVAFCSRYLNNTKCYTFAGTVCRMLPVTVLPNVYVYVVTFLSFAFSRAPKKFQRKRHLQLSTFVETHVPIK